MFVIDLTLFGCISVISSFLVAVASCNKCVVSTTTTVRIFGSSLNAAVVVYDTVVLLFCSVCFFSDFLFLYLAPSL